MKLLSAVCFLVGILSSASFVRADFVFEIDPIGPVNVSQSVSTGLYVRATSAASIADFSSLNTMSFNLAGSGGTVAISSWTKNPLFNLGAASAAPSGATLNQGLTFNIAGGPSAVAGRVKIGDIGFSGLTVGSTTFSFSDPTGGAATNVAYTSTSAGGPSVGVDNFVFTPGSSFTVTAVPEPSSMALLGLAGVGLAAVRRFRKKMIA